MVSALIAVQRQPNTPIHPQAQRLPCGRRHQCCGRHHCCRHCPPARHQGRLGTSHPSGIGGVNSAVTSCEPDAGAGQQIGSAAERILARRSEMAPAKLLDKVRDAGRANGDPAASEERMASTTLRSSFLPDSDEEIRGESAAKNEMLTKILSGSGSAGRS